MLCEVLTLKYEVTSGLSYTCITLRFWSPEISITNKRIVISLCNLHNTFLKLSKFSRDMRFPTMWYVLPAKAHTSLYILAV